jgi:hypothetical protein
MARVSSFPLAQPCWLDGADRAVTSQGISDGEDQYSGHFFSVIDVGILGSMVLSCFVTIPSMALKLWRMSPGIEGDAPADNIV